MPRQKSPFLLILDAPAHIIPGSDPLDRIPPDRFYGRAVLLDFTGKRAGTIGVADLEPMRRAVEKSEFVILRTGWSRLWGKDEYFREYPRPEPFFAL